VNEQHGGDLDQVRQGLRMAAPPDPQKLAAEKQVLANLDGAPRLQRWGGYLKFIGPGYLQSAMTLGSGTAPIASMPSSMPIGATHSRS
jgi:hypothetical protein